MRLVTFTEYLHEEDEERITAQVAYDKAKQLHPDYDEDFEDFCQKLGRPFYEVKIEAQFDLDDPTRKVTVTNITL